MVMDQVLEFVHVSDFEQMLVNMQLNIPDPGHKTYVHPDSSQIKPVVRRNPIMIQHMSPNGDFPDMFLLFVVSSGFQMDESGLEHQNMIQFQRITLETYNISQSKLRSFHDGAFSG
jgi:hypothetical protein